MREAAITEVERMRKAEAAKASAIMRADRDMAAIRQDKLAGRE